jgi:hypothetical protein
MPAPGTAGGTTAPLGRPEARLAVLLALRTSQSWWDTDPTGRGPDLVGDVSWIAHRLYDGRGAGQPFELLAWFEFVPDDEGRFEELVAGLRAADRWASVEREVDVRLSR